MIKKSRVLALMLVSVLAMSSVGFTAPNEKSNNGNGGKSAAAFDQNIVARVDAERAMEHIRVLSDEIGTRPGGMESEWEGARYIASVLESYGYETEFQPFPVADQYIATIELPDGQQWELGSMRNSLITGEGSVSGEVTFVDGGLQPGDFPDQVEGKIVLMERGSNTTASSTMVQNAANAGAKGVILYSVVGGRGNYGSAFTLNLSQETNIPVLGAAYIQGIWLQEMIKEGNIEVKIQTKHYDNLQSLNVIGTKLAKNKKVENAPVVILGGHMDSVVGAPGANDNASGVALMLELARVYSGANTDKELRFVAFGSEERGLLGARHYVEQLDQEESDRIIGVFNADMIATSYEGATDLYAMTVDGKHNLVTEAAVAAGARLGNSDILPGIFGSSDHVPFHNAGIPAALFIRMNLDWNPETGQIYDYVIEKVYHTPQDTIEDNVSIKRMQSALDIIGSAVYDVIRKEVPALENAKIRQ